MLSLAIYMLSFDFDTEIFKVITLKVIYNYGRLFIVKHKNKKRTRMFHITGKMIDKIITYGDNFYSMYSFSDDKDVFVDKTIDYCKKEIKIYKEENPKRVLQLEEQISMLKELKV